MRQNIDCVRAMPSARAATPSGLSRFASSCRHRIAIAIKYHLFCRIFHDAVQTAGKQYRWCKTCGAEAGKGRDPCAL